MTHRNGFMADMSSEKQAERSAKASRYRDSATQRKNSATSPWRKGPTVKSRNAHDAFARTVTGDAHNLRKDRKQGENDGNETRICGG